MIHLLKLSDEQLAVISEALMLAPYGKVAPIVMAINEQLRLTQKPDRDLPDAG